MQEHKQIVDFNKLWEVTAKYPRPGPTFYEIPWRVLEQKYPYFRLLGKAVVETRVNGVGTCLSMVRYKQYGQCGLQFSELMRHWEGNRAQTWEAKKWCEYLLRYPPYNITCKWDSDSQTLNTVCKEQMRLASLESSSPGI